MKKIDLLKKLGGIQTLESVKDILKVSKEKAIYHLHRLRKQGYVRTKRLSNNRRVYYISLENKLGGKSYYDIINEHSPVKITTPAVYRIYGKNPGLEETLVYAIKTRSFRAILAALSLFKKIHDWPRLYGLAKENNIERRICALYDLTRTITRTRRMPKRFRNNALTQKKPKFEYIIPWIKSEDFKDIEKVWKIRLPFNKKDLEEYQ